MGDTHQRGIVSPGTQVVTRTEVRGSDGAILRPKGALGVVVRSPADIEHAYTIRFPDGGEAALKRSGFHIRKHFQSEGMDGPRLSADDPVLRESIVYRCVIGSRAYGLEREDSDVDRRGVFLPPAELHWSLFGVPEQIEDDDEQACYWELQKFLVLALKANPNVLECLYSPVVELVRPPADELLAMRDSFLSKLVYQTYNGYVMSQFRKLGQDLRNRGEIKWKHAMHLVRLLLSGIAILREGTVPVRVEEHRDRLLAIRDGGASWEDVNAWRLELHRRFDEAFAATRLPDRPAYGKADALLLRARRMRAGGAP